MTVSTLPESPDAFADATWDDIAPYYDWLAQRPVDAGNIEEWLSDWSKLEEMLYEAASLASVAYTTDTADPLKEASHLRFSSEIRPRMQEQTTRLSERLVELRPDHDDLRTTIRRFENQLELFRDENVPLHGAIARLNADYQKVTGGMTVEWEGEEKTIPQLRPFLQSQDRETRERAFRLSARPYIEKRDELATLFDRQFELREQIARNAGFSNYRDYSFREKNRFDYTPEDCLRFHEAVEQTVVPAVERIHERRRQWLGLDRLRPWDLDVDPTGKPPLRPFDSAHELAGTAARIFQRVDPALGRMFQQMIDEGLLDLESRKGKAPGGYCTSFPYRGRPFIFMNAAKVNEDVRTLLHEAGHAFHVFEARRLPFIWQRHPGAEMAEVASMSMELLTAPYWGAELGGYYSAEDLRRARVDHLEGILVLLPHIASVDAFQHWLYTSGEGADVDVRDAEWLRIRTRFERGVDWSGLEAERVARWYRQLHIFLYPFYYIEYGIAQLGALQVWRNSLSDQSKAVERYRRGLQLGATRPLPELFEAAGARLVFDAGAMGELVALVEHQIAELDR